MSKLCRVLVAVAVTVGVSGCAAGRDFTRPAQESLILGQTTYKEIIERLGTPFQEETTTVNEQLVKFVAYTYSPRQAAADGMVPWRLMTFAFRDDVLVGHQFVSSFRDEHTDFDDTKIKQIRVGRTTRGQVIELLGRPSGAFVYPLAKSPGNTGLGYSYAQVRVRRGADTYAKDLRVSFDADDVVNDVKVTGSR